MQHSSINPRIAALSPYKPGKPVDEVARELGINDIVKLASNENPRGPGEKVQQAIAEAATELSRYPDGGGFALKSQLAEKIGVEPNQLTLGNGSNDVLDLIARVVLEPGAEAIIAEHSFVVYRLAVTCCGGGFDVHHIDPNAAYTDNNAFFQFIDDAFIDAEAP